MIRTKKVEAPKNHHVGCWIVLLILIIIIGGCIYYLYHNYSKEYEYDNSEKQAWMNIEKFDSEENFDSLVKYLDRYQLDFPNGRHSEQVMAFKTRVDSELSDWKKVQQNISVESLEDFVREHSDGYFRNVASRMIDSLLYAEAAEIDSYQSYQNYLDTYIDGRFADKAEARINSLKKGEIGKGEQKAIEKTLNSHFESLALNDQSRIMSTLSPQLDTYIGKKDASRMDVAMYMQSIHKDPKRSITFSIEDVNITKSLVDDEQQFDADFVLNEKIESDTQTEDKKFHSKVRLDGKYKIISMSIK
ncbi:MAG: hypothetical protein IKO36_12965, partial [Bacteroidaceae bacterium]|nr:hypothetical protein [Bacteroidaceae bacterium]